MPLPVRARRLTVLLVTAAALLAIGAPDGVSGDASAVPRPPDRAQAPEHDPFYRPPAGFEKTRPGTVLRSRPVTVAVGTTWPLNVTAWQLLYRTTDATGSPVATVTTAMLPGNARPERSRPLLAYQIAANSTPMRCAPSYQIRRSESMDNIEVQLEFSRMLAGLREGWAVTVPDHLGPRGQYTAGRMSGRATLDAIRATEDFAPMELAGRATPVGLWGYSGGAQATGWAAQLHRSYAPELDIVGAALGGVPADLRAVFDATNGRANSGIALGGIAGLMRAYPRLREFVDRHATPEGTRILTDVQSRCFFDYAARYAFRDVRDLMTIPEPLDRPLPRAVLERNRMSGQVPTAPMFAYQSVGDGATPIAAVDRWVAERCAAGNRTTYRRDLVSGHLTLMAGGSPAAVDWLRQRLSGNPATSGCDTRTVLSSLASPRMLAMFGEMLVDRLLDLTGRPVGPQPRPGSG